jgi:carboxyl-terminal processing protease
MKGKNMRSFKRSWMSLILILLFACGLLLLTREAESNDLLSSIGKNLEVLGHVYKKVSGLYVDRIDPDRFLKAGIDGMLSTLDPYTNYIENEDKPQLEIITHGKYGGVGLALTFRNNRVTVSEPPFLGTPSARTGIREGDQIIKVDDGSTEKMGFYETVKRIRGRIGTEVTLTVQREGESKLLTFTIVREQIKVEDVRYSGIVENNIGYIRLTAFSKNSAPEINRVLQEFKTQKLEGIILDLRSNSGGLLESAVTISDLFLPNDKVIVSTRGRVESSIRTFKSIKTPIYGDLPMIVLVNRFSASASEIVAGAIQDHDRGVVMGDTTFGKGLVQTVVPLTSRALLKITSAKYYTPSGRCIQKLNYSNWSDSMLVDKKSVYTTASGRPVYGSGGIAPDIAVQLPFYNDFVVDLRRKSLFFNFAVNYANTHETLNTNFQVDEKILQEFQQYLEEKGYKYEHAIETRLASLREEALERKYTPSFLKNIDNLQESLNSINNELFKNSEDDIKDLIQSELASKYFGTKREVEISLKEDIVFQKALKLLADETKYNEILTGKK